MAQFDSLIVLPLILSLLVVLALHYNISIGLIIPDFFEVKKFREKKAHSQLFYKFFDNAEFANFVNSYRSIFATSKTV
jgi:hypothetical protein